MSNKLLDSTLLTTPMQFVLLHHEMPGRDRDSHWDLMLEDPARNGGSDENEHRLWTWALAALPVRAHSSAAANRSPIPARKLPDHRAAYLSYEGEISGGRGHVTRIDRGEYELLEAQRSSGQLVRLVVRCSGEQLQGAFTLERQRDDDAAADSWQFSWAE